MGKKKSAPDKPSMSVVDMATLGGKARQAKLTKAQRVRLAKRAAAARWKKG